MINFKTFLQPAFCLFLYSAVKAQPLINSFSPSAGPVGTTVTISGNNFNVTTGNNTVFFGAAKANVMMASTSSLTVIVPIGCTYQPISITTGGLTAYSNKPFAVTFPGGGNLTTTSFTSPQVFSDIQSFNNGLVPVCDFDKDGKPDVATFSADRFVSVRRNITIPGIPTVSFAAPLTFSSGNDQNEAIATDFDCDGYKDLALCNSDIDSISFFRNMSTPGLISFGPRLRALSADGPVSMDAADFNKDGKPDIAVVNINAGNISIFQNTSSVSNISFAAKQDIAITNRPKRLITADIDGDGKYDIIAIGNSPNSVGILHNTSTGGNISFSITYRNLDMGEPETLCIGDIDGDGKLDLAIGNSNGAALVILRNTTVGNTISFSQDYFSTINHFTTNIAISDFNGDGKPDITTGVDMFQNISNPSNIGMTILPNFTAYSNLALADMNMDNKTDIIGASNFVFEININKSTDPVASSFSPVEGGTATVIDIQGSNLATTDTVKIGNSVVSFSVISDSHIQAVADSGTSGPISIITSYGTTLTSGSFTWYPKPKVISFTPTSAGPLINHQITITGTGFYGTPEVTAGGDMMFPTVVSSTIITAYVNQGNSGYIKVKTPGGADSLSGFTYVPLPPPPVINSFTPAAAEKDSFVLIKGQHFEYVHWVQFGNQPAQSFTVVSTDSILAQVGDGESGSISLETAGGTASIGGFIFKLPSPKLTSFSPASGTTGTAIHLYGQNFANITGISFGGIPAVSYTGVPTEITAYLGEGASGMIRLSSSNGNDSLPDFTFVPPTIIDTFFPASAQAGQLITIKGKSFNTAFQVVLGNSVIYNFSFLSDTMIKVIVSPGATSGAVRVYTQYGTGIKEGFQLLTSFPLISSFYPFVAKAGSKITISGLNFGNTPANNQVYFGNSPASILSASTSKISVTVPNGAMYLPVTVTSNFLTGTSPRSFINTFKNGSVSANSFAKKLTLQLTNGLHDNILMADIDMDGYNDILVNDRTAGIINLFRNTQNNNIPSYSPSQNINTGGTITRNLIVSDINGDGKLDIVALNTGSGNFSVLKNTGISGTISFATPELFSTSANPSFIAAGDIDQDGKIDIIVSYANGDSISVFKNKGNGGSLQFENSIRLFTGGSVTNPIAVSDIDNDGKPDLIISNAFNSAVTVFKNTSSQGFFSFSAPVSFSAGQTALTLKTGDLNNDGKTDIIYSNSNTGIFLLINTMSGSLSFAPVQAIPLGFTPASIEINDMDGDGKADICFTYTNQSQVKMSILRNDYHNNNISFNTAVEYNTANTNNPICMFSGDIDADGKPDVSIATAADNQVHILVNQAPSVQAFCAGQNVEIKANNTGSAYQWQINTGNGYTNIADNYPYSGSATASLHINTISSAFVMYKYRCIVNNTDTGREVFLSATTQWTGQVSTAWENPANWSCGSVPDLFSDVFIETGTVIINSVISVKSLTVSPGANLILNNGNAVGVYSDSISGGALSETAGTCAPVQLNGTLTQEVELNTTNTVQVQVLVLRPGPFDISTNTVDGMKFSKSGFFATTGLQTVLLEGSGIPYGYGSKSFRINFGTNACNFSANVSEAPTSYFPTTINSNWSYYVSPATAPMDTLFRQSLPGSFTVNGKQYRTFSRTTASSYSDNTGFRKEGNDYFMYLNNYAAFYSLHLLEATGEIKQLNDNLPVNSSWESYITGWINGGSQNTPIRVLGIITGKNATVTLYNGVTYNNVIKVLLRYYDISGVAQEVLTEERWFAPGIGLIQLSEDDGFSSVSEELRRYSIN